MAAMYVYYERHPTTHTDQTFLALSNKWVCAYIASFKPNRLKTIHLVSKK